MEWEMAARGGLSILKTEGATPPSYPYGDDFDPVRCNTLENGLHNVLPVTETEDESPYGVLGMCGNAPEWTASWYGPYPGHVFASNNPNAGNLFKVIRGGSYHKDRSFARSDWRDYGGFPNLAEDRSAGFRLIQRIR